MEEWTGVTEIRNRNRILENYQECGQIVLSKYLSINDQFLDYLEAQGLLEAQHSPRRRKRKLRWFFRLFSTDKTRPIFFAIRRNVVRVMLWGLLYEASRQTVRRWEAVESTARVVRENVNHFMDRRIKNPLYRCNGGMIIWIYSGGCGDVSLRALRRS